MGLLNTARSIARTFAPVRHAALFSSSARAANRPGPGDLNKYSSIITGPKDQGASQAMLYATEGIENQQDLSRAMVGVASVWYEGNPCNRHLLSVGQRAKKSSMKLG